MRKRRTGGLAGRIGAGHTGWLKSGAPFVLAAISLAVFYQWAVSRGVFDIREVRIVGARYSDPVDILNVASPELGKTIFEDHGGVSVMLRRMPMIKWAEVDRVPPGWIIIRVVEREPIAMLSDDTLIPVDEDGWVLPISASDFDLELPIVEPSGDYRIDAVGRVESVSVESALRFLKLVRASGLPLFQEISVLSVDEGGGITLTTVSQGHRVHLGVELSMDNVMLLCEVMKDLQDRGIESCTIDMRYKDQVVVHKAQPGKSHRERG